MSSGLTSTDISLTDRHPNIVDGIVNSASEEPESETWHEVANARGYTMYR